VDWHRSTLDFGEEIKRIKWEHVTEEHYKTRKEMRGKSMVIGGGVEWTIENVKERNTM
jgi:hypothetical protein